MKSESTRTNPDADDMPALSDRMMGYRRSDGCPVCGAAVVVCTIKRKYFEQYRCRRCDSRWEIGS